MRKYTTLQTRQSIVRLYTENHLTEREIANVVGVSPSTAHYWIARYDYARLPPVDVGPPAVLRETPEAESETPEGGSSADDPPTDPLPGGSSADDPPPDPLPGGSSADEPPPPPPTLPHPRDAGGRRSARTVDRGASYLDDRPKSGRPRKLDRETDEAIFEMSSGDPFAAATDIRSRLLLSDRVCAQTVRNRLRERGLRSRVPSRKDNLRDEHLEARKAFALSHLDWTAEQWDTVLFSDEKIFCIGGNGSPRVWRPVLKKNQRSLYPQYVTGTANTEWGRKTIPVWGCISSGGRHRNHVHLIDPVANPLTGKKTLVAQYYVDSILDPIVKGVAMANDDRDELVFMHDRSGIHMANLTGDWLVRNSVDTMFDWPAKGPDMNPIENVWGELERRLRNRNCRDPHELWMIVSREFDDLTRDPGDDALPSEYVKRLVGSMPRRVRTVYERRGGWSEY